MRSFLSTLLVAFLLLTSWGAPAFAQENDQLIAIVSDALVNAGSKDWARATEDLTKMQTLWAGTADSSAEAKAVDAALKAAQEAVQAQPLDEAAAKQAISALAKATDSFLSSHQTEDTSGKAKEKVQALLPHLQNSVAAVQAGDFAKAKQAYERFNTGWKQAEGTLRKDDFALYGTIEAKISGVRIALNTEPPSPEKSTAKLQDLLTALEDFVSGKAQAAPAAESGVTMQGVQQLLLAVQTDVQQQNAAAAAEKMDQIITAWPSLEGQVLTKSPDAYSRIETIMTGIPSFLLSSPPDYQQADQLVQQLLTELEPYLETSTYTAWDAGLILFREGFEAILIIAALLAFLKRTGNEDKRKWVWSGVTLGMLGSILMAIVLSSVLSSAAAGSSRELIEGYMGIIAVLFMVTVGAWLHKKSNMQAWNQFIEKTLGAVLAKGALWSLAATASLAVLREGSETVIFYLGMAPSIATSDLLLGIGVALLLLLIISFVLLKLSARIPIRPFFLFASLMLYYLAFKFIGTSVHSLQVAGQLPSHISDNLIQAPSLGLYQSWESTIPQVVVLVVVVVNLLRTERKMKRQQKEVTV